MHADFRGDFVLNDQQNAASDFMTSRIIIGMGKGFSVLAVSLLLSTVTFTTRLSAQSGIASPNKAVPSTIIETENEGPAKQKKGERTFRVEKTPVAGGAEIITIFADLKGLGKESEMDFSNVPMLSVLRDTLGDERIENDRLRYVWMHSYTRPAVAQKVAAAVPFLYRRTTNKGNVGAGRPPALLDLNPAEKDVWEKGFRLIYRNLVLDGLGIPIKAATIQYRINTNNYRRVANTRALGMLSLFQSDNGAKMLSDTELRDVQARMMISDELLGSFMRAENLERVYRASKERTSHTRGPNWEILRQYSEGQGLYFEPLEMPDGSATHAIVWVAQGDLQKNRGRKFNSRFLNIKNPWSDARLSNWSGYSKIRYFDEENRPAEAGAPNIRSETMIPLAVYGLDFPKIPVILVDFRDRYNPKRRELSKRVLGDIAENGLSIARFANLPLFVGYYAYIYVVDRRGRDINQDTRLDSYSQLKLQLSLDVNLDPRLRREISQRLEAVSLNPLENDLGTEVKVARQQYENLMIYARRGDGLPKLLENDRRSEMARLKHTGAERLFFSVANALSFGIYNHRERDTPELRAEMDQRRRLDYHERYLLETARKSAQPEIDGDPIAIKKSLEFVSQDGARARERTPRAISQLFFMTDDEQIRLLCISSLKRIENSNAEKELLAISENELVDEHWRKMSAEYLSLRSEGRKRKGANKVKVIATKNTN